MATLVAVLVLIATEGGAWVAAERFRKGIDGIDAASLVEKRREYAAGSEVVREGDPGDELFVIAKGSASARLRQASGGDLRLVTFAQGTVFGELAILDSGPRSLGRNDG